jgi:pimeloyl-ACP methyl ester carboxylesterase
VLHRRGGLTELAGADPSLPTERVAIEGGRTLRVARADDRPPAVLYDAGAFGIYADGANVVRALGALGVPAAAYTRAGLSGSGPAADAPTPERHAEDMLALLDALGAEGPVTFIGHSMAGLRLHRLAQLHPQRVGGLVLVDAMVPAATPPAALRAFAASLRPVERTLPVLCRAGNAYPNAMRLTGQERADKLASVYSASHLRATRAEVEAMARSVVEPAGDAPMVLMPAGRIARGTDGLARRTGARVVDMSRWGHASVLSPEPSRMIAREAARLLGA